MLVVSLLIVLHNIDGEQIAVNPDHVTTLHPTRDRNVGTPNRLVTDGANCVVGLSNGKILSVIEDCPTVRKMMGNAK